VLVDYRSGDDAGVFRLDDRTTLVQTVDFFTPIVDDPEQFGEIAAANALSDIYAMGGRPLTALSIAAVPDKEVSPAAIAAVHRGGFSKLAEAGCVLLGGHTVRDAEMKFGYAVTGLVDPGRILTLAGGRAGDILVLTKPLGTGIIATALKAGSAPAEAVDAAVRSMVQLNARASEAALGAGASAATDVTGFGLLGHAAGIARESNLTLELRAEALPALPCAVDLAPRFQAGGLKANRRHFEPQTELSPGVSEGHGALLYDPQTSGGLLLLVPPERMAWLRERLPEATEIGRATQRGQHPLRVL
jgi:selenide,water dikinase